MLLPKIGAPAHPANVHRLLYDEGQLVLVFPEGRKGTEKLYHDRYRLRRFGRGGFVEAAMRAGAKLVPVCVVGAEEAAPIFAQVPMLQRLTGLIYFPITPTFPHLGPLGMLGYLPAKFKIRFLPPVRTDDMGDEPWEDKGLVQTVAHEVRARIQDELFDMVGRAQVGVVRMNGPATRQPGQCWITRPLHLLGRAARAGARAQPRGRGDHRRRLARTRRVELERTEFVRVGTQHALIRRIVQAAEIDTVVDTRLVVDSIAASRPACPHENNVIGTMNILAACAGPDSPVRKLVFKSAHYYGCEQDDPAFFTEEMGRPHPPRTPIERDIVEAEAAVARLCEQAPRRDRDGPAALPTSSGRASRPRTPGLFSTCRRSRRSWGSTRATSSSHVDDVVHALEYAAATIFPGSTTSPATGCSRSRRSSTCWASGRCRCCRPGGPGSRRRRCAELGFRIPGEMLLSCASGAGSTTASSRRPGSVPKYTTSREAVLSSASTCGCGRCWPGPASPTATSARSRSSCAGARTCSAASQHRPSPRWQRRPVRAAAVGGPLKG